MFSPRAVYTVCLEEQCWNTGKSNTGPSYSRLIVQCMLVLILILFSVLCSPGNWTVLSAPKTDRWSRECCWKNSILSLTNKFGYMTLQVVHTLKLSSCRVHKLLFTWKALRWQLNVIIVPRGTDPYLPNSTLLFIVSGSIHESMVSLMSS